MWCMCDSSQVIYTQINSKQNTYVDSVRMHGLYTKDNQHNNDFIIHIIVFSTFLFLLFTVTTTSTEGQTHVLCGHQECAYLCFVYYYVLCYHVIICALYLSMEYIYIYGNRRGPGGKDWTTNSWVTVLTPAYSWVACHQAAFVSRLRLNQWRLMIIPLH